MLTVSASVTLLPQSPGVLTPVLLVFVVGLLFMSLGPMLPDGAQYATGAWIMVVAVAAIFTPPPAHVLVLAIGAGGGMLVLGRIIARRVA